MSIVCITDHDENIYRILTSSDEKQEQSVPIEKRKITFKIQKRPLFESAKPDPENFLRKRPKFEYLPRYKFKRERVLTKPPVPETAPTVKEQNEKLAFVAPNIIKRNILKMVNSKPKSPERVLVTDETGTRVKLNYSTEVNYVNRKKFARLPDYVNQYKVSREKRRLLTKSQRSAEQKAPCSYIVRDKRTELLSGLKSNWEELQKQYQKLPILTDTVQRKQRKSQLDNELRQLEKDIVLIERHPFIYVYDDDDLRF